MITKIGKLPDTIEVLPAFEINTIIGGNVRYKVYKVSWLKWYISLWPDECYNYIFSFDKWANDK